MKRRSDSNAVRPMGDNRFGAPFHPSKNYEKNEHFFRYLVLNMLVSNPYVCNLYVCNHIHARVVDYIGSDHFKK